MKSKHFYRQIPTQVLNISHHSLKKLSMHFVRQLESAFLMCTYTKKALNMQVVDSVTKQLFYKICYKDKMESCIIDESKSLLEIYQNLKRSDIIYGRKGRVIFETNRRVLKRKVTFEMDLELNNLSYAACQYTFCLLEIIDGLKKESREKSKKLVLRSRKIEDLTVKLDSLQKKYEQQLAESSQMKIKIRKTCNRMNKVHIQIGQKISQIDRLNQTIKKMKEMQKVQEIPKAQNIPTTIEIIQVEKVPQIEARVRREPHFGKYSDCFKPSPKVPIVKQEEVDSQPEKEELIMSVENQKEEISYSRMPIAKQEEIDSQPEKEEPRMSIAKQEQVDSSSEENYSRQEHSIDDISLVSNPIREQAKIFNGNSTEERLGPYISNEQIIEAEVRKLEESLAIPENDIQEPIKKCEVEVREERDEARDERIIERHVRESPRQVKEYKKPKSKKLVHSRSGDDRLLKRK